MTPDQGIIRFDSHGPPWRDFDPIVEITPDMVEQGTANELRHNYYRSPSGVLAAGV